MGQDRGTVGKRSKHVIYRLKRLILRVPSCGYSFESSEIKGKKV